MNGKTDEEILQEREFAIMELNSIIKKPFEIVDTFFDFPPDKGPLYYLGASIAALDEADFAYFLKGWEKYRGCQIEHECCKEYGVLIIYQN